MYVLFKDAAAINSRSQKNRFESVCSVANGAGVTRPAGK